MHSTGSKQMLQGIFGLYASLPQQDSIIIFMAGLHVFVYLYHLYCDQWNECMQ